MARNEDKRRVLLVAGASVLIASGVCALAFSDRKTADEIQQEIETLDARIASADAEIRKSRDREDEVLVYRAVQSRELEILPRQQQIADFHSNLTMFLQQAGARFTELPDSAPKESELARGVYVTPNSIEFEADAEALLKFVNIVEVDPRLVAVKGLKVKSAGRQKDEGDRPAHKAVVSLETYYYSPLADARPPVPIPNEAERLEDPAIRAKIAAFQPERRDTYKLRPSSARRDPFVDFRKAVVREDPDALRRRFESEEAVVVDLEKRNDDLREKAEEEKALSNSGNFFVRDRVARDLDALLNDLRVRVANVASVKTVSIAELVTRVDKVRQSVEAVAATRRDLPRDMTVSADVAKDTLALMASALEAGDYAEVTSTWVAWEQFLRGKAVEPGAAEVLEQIRQKWHRGKAVAQFEGLGLEVTGVMVNPQNPLVAVALVNGRSVRRGEPVAGNEDVLVAEIRRDGVEFEFQGERIFRRRQVGGSSSGGAPGRGVPARTPGKPSRSEGGPGAGAPSTVRRVDGR